jgi:peptide/nickel transport system permease protein
MPDASEGSTPTLAQGAVAAGPSGPPEPIVSAPEDRALSTRQLAWRRFKRHKLAVASAVVLILITLSAILAPLLAKYNYHQIFTAGTKTAYSNGSGPSFKHYLGVDEIGRDEFSRVLYGGRVSLLVGFTVALSAGIIGTLIGAIAGFYGRWVDNLLMRVTDLFLSMPFLVILIVAAAALHGSVFDIVLILSLFFWMPDARIVRGLFLSLKEKEFVESARASGATNKRIIFYHILPNTMGPIIVTSTLNVAAAILTESALSFLGFGVQPPTPTWGGLLEGARPLIQVAPGLTWFPGLGILITVLCVNFLGDGLRDALDPHQRIGGNI